MIYYLKNLNQSEDTLLFLILGILHVSADTYAQKAQVTVEVKNGTFYDVVSEIEKQTEFMFFY